MSQSEEEFYKNLNKTDKHNNFQKSNNSKAKHPEIDIEKINSEDETKDVNNECLSKKRTTEFNKLALTAINESDERMINESCEFSETSINENPHYLKFRSSLEKRNTNEKDRSTMSIPFEKASNNNTYIEFDSINNYNIKTPQKKISEKDNFDMTQASNFLAK